MHELVDQLLLNLKAIWRHRWYAVVVAWMIALGGWTAVHLMPDRYEARARVEVDTESMLRPLLVGLAVQPNTSQMIAMMGQTLVSRQNVERVIQTAGLDTGLETAEDQNRLITEVTKGIRIEGTGRTNQYTITYTANEREHTKRVVQSLLTIFMERSVGDKREDSESALKFIEAQLSIYSEKLKAAEQAVTEFKRRHRGLMPGEGQSFYAQLGDVKRDLRRATLELEEALKSRDAIRIQLAEETEIASWSGDKGATAMLPSELDTRIQALEQKLDGLRLTYTELHPDIIALVRIIAQLKEQRTLEEKIEKPAPNVPKGQAHAQLTVALASAEAQVAAMKARVAEYSRRYAELEATANAVPQVEAEFKQLTRDYDVIRTRYDKLLERRESAQISGDVEASDVVMGFRVIDPPQVPHVPSAPDRPRLMSFVLLAALGGGLGFALLLGSLRRTFNDERALVEASGLRVLGTIPMASTEKQKRRRAGGLIAFVLSFLSLLSAYFAIMVSLMMTVSRA